MIRRSWVARLVCVHRCARSLVVSRGPGSDLAIQLRAIAPINSGSAVYGGAQGPTSCIGIGPESDHHPQGRVVSRGAIGIARCFKVWSPALHSAKEDSASLASVRGVRECQTSLRSPFTPTHRFAESCDRSCAATGQLADPSDGAFTLTAPVARTVEPWHSPGRVLVMGRNSSVG